jgi:hypothetical protein
MAFHDLPCARANLDGLPQPGSSARTASETVAMAVLLSAAVAVAALLAGRLGRSDPLPRSTSRCLAVSSPVTKP